MNTFSARLSKNANIKFIQDDENHPTLVKALV